MLEFKKLQNFWYSYYMKSLIIKLYNILPVILILAFLNLNCYKERKSTSITKWSIQYSQDNNLKMLLKKPSNWVNFEIPANFTLPYSKAREFQYAWLKGEFNIGDELSDYYGISIRNIRFSEEVFINNKHLGARSRNEFCFMHLPRNYIIPDGVLKKGNNILYIRIGIYGDEYGGISDKIELLNHKDFIGISSKDNLIYKLIPFGIIFLFLCLMMALKILFFISRKKKILYFSLGLLIYVIHILSLFSPNGPININFVSSIYMTTAPALFIILILIIQALYSAFLSRYNKIVIPLLLIIDFGIIMSGDILSINIHRILEVLTILFFIPFTFILIYQLNKVKPGRPRLLTVVLISLIAFVIMIIKIILDHTGLAFPGLLIIYLSPIFVILISIQFSINYKKRELEQKHLYETLRNLNGDENKLIITDESEEKIKKVIEFLKNNYTSDISREGLAEAAGISPNYMSSLFNLYTGMKINEFINALRVKEAAKKLKEKDTNVLETAFAVGFESLSTFNRSFKKILGMTPTQYLNQK